MTTSAPDLVTVVMPTYNHAGFIGDAIRSVLRQSYADLELIIVDNFSRDNTAEIVAACGDPRIRYVKFANNGIIAASRNHGVGLARGAYVAFIDSDDLWLPEKLKKQVEAFLSHKNVSMIYSRYKTIVGDAVSGSVLPRSRRCAGGDIFKALYLGHFIACSGVMVKKSVLAETGGFDVSPALVAVEDVDLWLRIALAGRIYCASDEPLFLYRVHPGNLSQGYYKKYKRASLLLEKFAGKAGLPAFIEAKALLSLSIIKQKLSDLAGRVRVVVKKAEGNK